MQDFQIPNFAKSWELRVVFSNLKKLMTRSAFIYTILVSMFILTGQTMMSEK